VAQGGGQECKPQNRRKKKSQKKPCLLKILLLCIFISF
jgi:hypothetical protein